MLLTLDVGNTNVTIGLFEGEQLRATWRIATDLERLADEYAVTVLGLLQNEGISPSSVDAAVMAVVGAVVGDFFFTQGSPGLGQLINLDASQLQYERMYTSVILAMLLGIAAYLAVVFAEKRVIGKWHTTTRGGV